MNKHFVPTYLSNNVFSINPHFFVAIGKKAVLLDLDNTLDPVDIKEPSERAIAYVEGLKKEGLKVYVASNNTGKRVSTYCEKLNIEAASGLLKPFSFRLKKWIKKTGYKKEEVILVGDQIFTDVLSAKGANIDILLTKPLSPRDSVFTLLNRKLEKPIRDKIKKKKLSKHWEEVTL